MVIDAFRLINPNVPFLGQEPRQTTSVLGHLQKPSIQVITDAVMPKMVVLQLVFLQALIHGLNRHYYSISINYRKNELEQRMLMNLNKKSWSDGMTLMDYNDHCQLNKDTVKEMLTLARAQRLAPHQGWQAMRRLHLAVDMEMSDQIGPNGGLSFLHKDVALLLTIQPGAEALAAHYETTPGIRPAIALALAAGNGRDRQRFVNLVRLRGLQ